jgi:hypothetical protein
MSQPSIYVGMIAHRTIEAGTVSMLWQLARTPVVDVDLDLHVGDALVTRARSTLATRFLRDARQDVLVTVDSDIVFHPLDLIQIASQAHELHSIVVGMYLTRAWEKGAPASLLDEEPIEFNMDSTLRPIVWGANGFMACPRSVFQKMVDELDLPLMHPRQDREFQHYPFYEAPRGTDPMFGDPITMSEDFDFCAKAKQVGVQTYVNPAVRLGHLGTMVFRLEHMAWKEPPRVPMRLSRSGFRYAVEADVPPELVPFSKGVQTQPVKLSRQQLRHLDRQREKVTA